MVLRTGPEIGGRGTVRCEWNGFMVAVGWTGQEPREYEVVGHFSGYRMTCFRKLSDEIRLSSSPYSLCFFPCLFVVSSRKSEFLYTPPPFLSGVLF